MQRIKKSLLTAAIAAAALSPAVAPAADFKIGLLLPFSGVYTALGSHIENGFKLGLDHFGGSLGAHTITLVRDDTEAKPAVGLVKAKKMVLQDKVDAIAGIVSSAVLGAMRDFAHGSKTPIVVANAGNDAMTGAKCSPYIVRVSFSNSQITRSIGSWLALQGVKKAYLMAPDYAAGHQMMDAFRRTYTAAGGTIVGEAYPPLQGTKDYGSYLSAAKASDAEALFVFFAGGAAITFVKQYAGFGLSEELPLYGAGFLTSAAYVHVQGAAADGVVASLHYVPGLDNPENNRFQADYKKKFGKTGSEFSVQGYDAARMIVEAIKASNGDKDAFKAALSKVSFNGPRGPLRIDPKTNNVVQNIYIFRNEFRNDKVAQEVLETVGNVQDEVNGCSL